MGILKNHYIILHSIPWRSFKESKLCINYTAYFLKHQQVRKISSKTAKLDWMLIRRRCRGKTVNAKNAYVFNALYIMYLYQHIQAEIRKQKCMEKLNIWRHGQNHKNVCFLLAPIHPPPSSSFCVLIYVASSSFHMSHHQSLTTTTTQQISHKEIIIQAGTFPQQHTSFNNQLCVQIMWKVFTNYVNKKVPLTRSFE